MKKWITLCLVGLVTLCTGQAVLSAETSTAVAPYLLTGAPAFDLSISQFREKRLPAPPAKLMKIYTPPPRLNAVR